MNKHILLNRIFIVMITTLQVFSGLILGMNWSAERVRADTPIFATIYYNNPPTGGEGFWVSANISEVPGAHEVYFNCTIYGLSSETHVRNLQVANVNRTGTSWLIVMLVPIPNDGTSINFNFTAWNTTGGGVARSYNGTISIIDTITPTAIAKCNTTAQPTLKDVITVVEGTTVNFDGSSTTDNLQTDSWSNWNWRWEILPALTKQGKTVSHTFTNVGVYTVRLNVSDAAGNWDTDTVTVTVEPADMPPGLNPQATSYLNRFSELLEDSDYTSITLIDNGTGTDYLFNYTGPGTITFKINSSGTLQDTYESDNLTGRVSDTDGNVILRIKPKADVYFKSDVLENIIINATTSAGSLEHTIPFKIRSQNDPPIFVQPSGATVVLSEGGERSIFIKAKDSADPEDTLTLTTNITTAIPSLTATVVNTTCDEETNTHTFKLNLTPTNDMVGDHKISLMITDNDYVSTIKSPIMVYKNITLSIKNINDAPAFGEMKIGETIGKEGMAGDLLFDIDEDEEVVINVTFEDPDLLHHVADFTVQVEERKNHSKAEIEVVGYNYANLTFQAKVNFHGFAMVKISLSDGTDVVYRNITFNVKEVNDDPDFSTMDIKVTKTLVDKKISKYYFSLNHSYSNAPVVTGDITDIDEDTVMFDWFIRPDPSGDAVFNESWQSSLSGTNIIYAFKVTGNYSVWVKAVDGKGGTDVKKLLTGIIIEEHITPSSGPDGGLGGWLYVIISIIVLISIVVIAFILIVNRKGYVKENETGGIATGDERMGNRSQFGINQIEHPPAGMQKPLGISIDISPAITTFACDMCNGNIAIGDLMITCHCKKRYHPECIIRKGDCPICGVIYSHMNNEQGFSRTKGNNSVDIPMDDADSNVDNTANNAARTYRVYSSLTCQICFGHIKKGDRAHQCGCGKIFHPSCIARVGECPTCELVYSSDQFSSYGNDNEEKASGNDSNQVVFEDDDDDEYSPPKYTGDILTSEPQEKEIPNVITTTDVNTVQGSYHLYNMLLAKKGSEIRIGPVSSKSDIGKARKQIIMMYHPDKWQSDKDKATFFMQKVNVAWEVLSAIPR